MRRVDQSVIIRSATLDEIPAVAALARESFMAAVAPHFSTEGIRTFLEFADAERIRVRMNEGGRTLVAYDGAELVGMANIRGKGHLAMLFVAPNRQRSGIGRKLLDAVIAGSDAAVVTVNSSPNAEPAYRNFGFIRTADEQEVTGIRFIPMEWRRGGGC